MDWALSVRPFFLTVYYLLLVFISGICWVFLWPRVVYYDFARVDATSSYLKNSVETQPVIINTILYHHLIVSIIISEKLNCMSKLLLHTTNNSSRCSVNMPNPFNCSSYSVDVDYDSLFPDIDSLRCYWPNSKFVSHKISTLQLKCIILVTFIQSTIGLGHAVTNT